ncbi:hypothetical protein [Pedobacter hartonius]|uniref:Uncharacterized protein n=1 Tax=Pedobacter hartonius TaxID=425514 RepID=A0A1H4HI32_9SPHI|nr:hypothetical protein [Pedobacter hartonius]SEB20688.1 hypothetical protein SAMN05443550_11728 [Pedobacter hartonius]
MAKRRTRKAAAKKMGFKQVIVSLAILFSAVLFIIKIFIGSVGWFEVFAPIIIAFVIVFLLSAIKAGIRKI